MIPNKLLQMLLVQKHKTDLTTIFFKFKSDLMHFCL